ncbi:TetR/AcrR family transcriptional regulator [Spongiibacter sp.]|uniref:TetR/AcrR family transcriptional regulator n=1 Tax=Spongiibacter sp. TaxID=2024860 RepID=UPI0035650DF4
MKTREKILLASLVLFNDEGEANVTTVDIANELNISPGNLYYHFHGKEEIIQELYSGFELELTDILEAPLQNSLSPQDAWFYLYIVFEQLFKHRYLYRNLNDILQRYPEIDRRFRKLLELKLRSAQAVADELVAANILDASDIQLSRLCDNVVLNLTFWLNYNSLRERHCRDDLTIHRGVFQLMSLIAPYLTDDFRYFYDDCCALFEVLSRDD